MVEDQNFIIETQIYHERFKPFNHRFIYRMFYLKFPLDQIEKLQVPFFSLNRFNLYSLYFKDYLDGSNRPLKEKITELLRSHGLKAEGKIVLHTAPRILGYGFNPVSFWYVYKQENELEAIMAEVNNTFGDRHYYLMNGFQSFQKLKMEKIFHVSPFFAIEGLYEFSFTNKNVVINYFDKSAGDYFFKSSMNQIKAHGFTTQNLLKMFVKFPFMTFFVTGRIHWQALKLFVKKAKIFTRPEPPSEMMSKDVQL